MAGMYLRGEGTKKNTAKAEEWKKRAAASGNPQIQFELGEWYYSGKELKQDYRKSLELFEKAGKAGYAPALYNAGVQYERGDGVKADKNMALLYYQRAADNGLKAAEEALKRIGATASENGDKTEKQKK
jgi:hypothetical protein